MYADPDEALQGRRVGPGIGWAGAMSEERVRLVEQLMEAFNARDVDGFVRLTTEDFEWFTSVMAVEGEVFVGRKGIETYFQRMVEMRGTSSSVCSTNGTTSGTASSSRGTWRDEAAEVV